MENPVPDYLQEVAAACTPHRGGTPASYIPELASVDPDRFGVALATLDGTVYAVGDSDVEFTIQSISKAFVYGLAIREHGLEAVLDTIDVEPSGDPFDELSLEPGTGRPSNPMINAGAITAHTLIGDGADPEERFERIRAHLSALAGRELTVNEKVWQSELATSDRNLAIIHMLRNHGTISERAGEVIESYTRQCAINVTTRDLATMAATLANGGVQPVTGERIYEPPLVRHVLSVMLTCGMYDSAGDWASSVGIPAKSGVGGGIIGTLPGQVGIASFSPRLDAHGNSVRGVETFERLSRDMGLHLMAVAPPARAVMHSSRVERVGEDLVRIYELAGTIGFSGAERVVERISANPPEEPVIAFDLSRVHSVRNVARRMLLECLRRLRLEGYEVRLVDEQGVLPDPDLGDGAPVAPLRSGA